VCILGLTCSAGATYSPVATSDRGLTVSLTVDPSSATVCGISSGAVYFSSVGSCTVVASQNGNGDFVAAVAVTQTVVVTIGSQVVTFTSSPPDDPIIGGPSYTVSLQASSGLTATLQVDPASATICTLSGFEVSFIGTGQCRLFGNQGGNSNYLAAPQAVQLFGVGLTRQFLTLLSTPSNPVVGGPTYTVMASSTSGLVPVITIDISTSSACSSAGNVVTFLAAQACLILIDQPGNGTTNAAAQLQQTVTIGKGSQTLTFDPAPVAIVGGPTYSPVVTSSVGLPSVLSVTTPSVCSLTGGVVSFIGAGSCDIIASNGGSSNFNASSASQTVIVGRGNQLISFVANPAGAQVAGPTFSLTATSTSGLTVVFASSTPLICTVSARIVSFVGVGNCTITGDVPQTTDWNAAPTVSQTFPVFKGVQSIVFTTQAPNNAVVNGASFSVAATSSAALPVSFSIDTSSSAVCTLTAPNVVNFIGSGSCVVNADQAGDLLYLSASQAKLTIPVAAAGQTISITSTAPTAARVAGPLYAATATATSGLSVTFTVDQAASSGSEKIAFFGFFNSFVW
jgi:hypothetical protein